MGWHSAKVAMTTATSVEKRKTLMKRRKKVVERRQVTPVTLLRNSQTVTLAVQILDFSWVRSVCSGEG